MPNYRVKLTVAMLFACGPATKPWRWVQAPTLSGLDMERDWFDYRLENDPRFLKRIEDARKSLRAGRGIRHEDV